MSGNIRDLVVGIEFDNVDIRQLLRVDSAIDEIEDELRHMGISIDDASQEFSQMGTEALIASAMAEAALRDVQDAADDAGDEMDDLGDETEAAGLKAVLMGSAFTAAFSGAVAAAAPLLLITSGLASSLAAAYGAAAVFGAVAIPIVTGLFETESELQKLQDKVDAAKTAKERTKAQKELANAMAGVSKEEKTALKELHSFKDFWGGFTKQFEPGIFKAFGTTLQIVKGIFKGLAPTISAVTGVVNKLLDGFNQELSNGGLKGFFDWLASNGAGAIQSFATSGMNVIAGLFNLMSTFAPVGAVVEEKIVSLTEKFKNWSATFSSSQGFQNFVEYAKTNGPILWALLGNIWDTVKNLVIDLAPLGTVVLTALTNITTLIVNNWPAIRETIIGVGVAVGSFIAIMKGMQIIGAINTLMIAFRTGTVLATLAQWGLNTAMLANPITWVIAGIAALIAIGVLLYRHWDTVKAKAGELWSWLKEKWAGIKQSTAAAWDSVKTKISSAMDTAKQKVSNFFAPLLNFISNAKQKWDEFVGKITSFKMPKIGIPKFLGGNGFIQNADGSHATGLSRVPFDGYRALLHKDEAVLTAKQSDALRAAGILDTSSKRPSLNAGASVTPTGRMKSGTNVFSPSITIQVNGASGDSNDIAKKAAYAAKRELEKLFTQLGLAYE